MAKRKYTASEIQALRHAEENLYLYGSYGGPPQIPNSGGASRSYREGEMARVVEERVRTDMLAELTAADLTGA